MSLFSDLLNMSAPGWDNSIISRYKKRKPGEGLLDVAVDNIGDNLKRIDDTVVDPIGNILFGEAIDRPESQTPQAQRVVNNLDNPFRNQIGSSGTDLNQQLRDAIDQKVNSNRWLTQRARRQIMPIYRPQIRAARQNMRSTMRQGKRAASDVMGYYDQAGAKVAGLSKASGRSQKRAMNKLGSGNAEARIAGNAMRGQGKATRSFFKQLQGSLAGEGAVAAADTRRSYNSLANEYRTQLGELQAQRNAALMAAKQEMKRNVNKAGEKIYEQNFLESLGAGMTRKQAAKQALAAGGAKGKAVKSQVARSILANRGNENVLLSSMVQDNQPSFDEQIDRAKIAIDIVNAIGDNPASEEAANIRNTILQQLAAPYRRG